MHDEKLADEEGQALQDLVHEHLYSVHKGTLPVGKIKETMSRFALQHKAGFFHYVRASRLKSMMEYGKVFLSRATGMNDKLEACDVDPRDYYICMNYGRDENVAMWGMYGKPREESVRIHFAFSAVKALVNNMKARLEQGKVIAYMPNFKSDGGAGFEPIDSSKIEYVEFHDVAYMGASETTVEHCRSFYKLDRKPTAKDKIGLSTYLKKRGWAYEHEVRLVVRLRKQLKNADGSPVEKIAIDFMPVFDVMKDTPGSVVTGPDYAGNPVENLSAVLPSKCITRSEYTGMIDFGDSQQ